jgi:hypothetical protein
MACNITSGIPRGCRENKGGVFQFYIASYPTVMNVTLGGTNDEITEIKDGTTSLEFFPFVPNKGSSDFTETYQTSLEEYGDSRTQEPTVEGNFRMRL